MKKLFVILCWIILNGICPAVEEPINDYTPQIRIDYKLWMLTVGGSYAEIEFGATLMHGGRIDKGIFTVGELAKIILPKLQAYETKEDGGSIIFIHKKGTADVDILENENIHHGSLSADALYPIWEKAFANVKPHDAKEFAMLMRRNDPFSGMRENLNSYIARAYPKNSEMLRLRSLFLLEPPDMEAIAKFVQMNDPALLELLLRDQYDESVLRALNENPANPPSYLPVLVRYILKYDQLRSTRPERDGEFSGRIWRACEVIRKFGRDMPELKYLPSENARPWLKSALNQLRQNHTADGQDTADIDRALGEIKD